jgi:hypothetical protein
MVGVLQPWCDGAAETVSVRARVVDHLVSARVYDLRADGGIGEVDILVGHGVCTSTRPKVAGLPDAAGGQYEE